MRVTAGCPVEFGRMLGEGLGRLSYALRGELLENSTLKRLLLRHTPVILLGRGGRGGHMALSQFGRIGPAFSALIQQHRDLETLLDALGSEWRFDSLVHGDMKWDNVVVFPAG